MQVGNAGLGGFVIGFREREALVGAMGGFCVVCGDEGRLPTGQNWGVWGGRGN